jgi:hypothetical protein
MKLHTLVHGGDLYACDDAKRYPTDLVHTRRDDRRQIMIGDGDDIQASRGRDRDQLCGGPVPIRGYGVHVEVYPRPLFGP